MNIKKTLTCILSLLIFTQIILIDISLHANDQSTRTEIQLNRFKQKIAHAYDATKQFVLNHKALLSGIGTVVAGYIGYRLLWNTDSLTSFETTKDLKPTNQEAPIENPKGQSVPQHNELADLKKELFSNDTFKSKALRDIRPQISDYILSPYTRQDILELFKNQSPKISNNNHGWLLNPYNNIIFTAQGEAYYTNKKIVFFWDLKRPNNHLKEMTLNTSHYRTFKSYDFEDHLISIHHDGSFSIIENNIFDLYDIQHHRFAQISKHNYHPFSSLSDQSGKKICLIFKENYYFDKYIKIIDRDNIYNVLFEKSCAIADPMQVQFSPQGKYIIFHDAQETFIYDLELKKKIGQIIFQSAPIIRLPRWLSDDLLLIGGNKEGKGVLELYETSGEKIKEISLKSRLADVIPSPDRKNILIVCDNYTEIWNIEKDDHYELPCHFQGKNKVFGFESEIKAAWNPDSNLLAISCSKPFAEDCLQIWDVPSKKLKYEFAPDKHHGYNVMLDRVQWTMDNKLVYSFLCLTQLGQGPNYPLPIHILDIPKLDRLMQKVDQKDIRLISLLRAKLEKNKRKPLVVPF